MDSHRNFLLTEATYLERASSIASLNEYLMRFEHNYDGTEMCHDFLLTRGEIDYLCTTDAVISFFACVMNCSILHMRAIVLRTLVERTFGGDAERSLDEMVDFTVLLDEPRHDDRVRFTRLLLLITSSPILQREEAGNIHTLFDIILPLAAKYKSPAYYSDLLFYAHELENERLRELILDVLPANYIDTYSLAHIVTQQRLHRLDLTLWRCAIRYSASLREILSIQDDSIILSFTAPIPRERYRAWAFLFMRRYECGPHNALLFMKAYRTLVDECVSFKQVTTIYRLTRPVRKYNNKFYIEHDYETVLRGVKASVGPDEAVGENVIDPSTTAPATPTAPAATTTRRKVVPVTPDEYLIALTDASPVPGGGRNKRKAASPSPTPSPSPKLKRVRVANPRITCTRCVKEEKCMVADCHETKATTKDYSCRGENDHFCKGCRTKLEYKDYSRGNVPKLVLDDGTVLMGLKFFNRRFEIRNESDGVLEVDARDFSVQTNRDDCVLNGLQSNSLRLHINVTTGMCRLGTESSEHLDFRVEDLHVIEDAQVITRDHKKWQHAEGSNVATNSLITFDLRTPNIVVNGETTTHPRTSIRYFGCWFSKTHTYDESLPEAFDHFIVTVGTGTRTVRYVIKGLEIT